MSGCWFNRNAVGYWLMYLISIHLFTYARGGAGGGGASSADADDDGVRLTLEPADVLAPWGGRVLLPCRARAPRSSSHSPQISWRHRKDAPPTPADLLPAHDPRRSLLANGSLVIEETAPGTAGWYQCVVSVDGLGAVVSRPALVLLAEAPVPVPGPRTVLGVAGSPLVLPCAVSSHPRLAIRIVTAAASERRVYGPTKHNLQPPTLHLNVTWVRGDGSAVRGEAARVTVSASGALELEPAAVRDAGRYRCNVSLAAPYLTAETPAHVRYRLGDEIEVAVGTDSGLDSPPRFVLTPQPTTVIEGSSVTLECAAVGNPRPEMVWLNNGVAIDLNDLDSRFYLVGAGSLRVQWARALDAGSYTCRAHNRLDSADHSTQLTVLSPPRVSIVGGGAVRARVRGDVTLRCEARGRPVPAVTWLKDGEPLTPNDHDIVLVDGDDLRIQGVLEVDAGMFQCAASSIAGDAVAALRLIVLPPNDATLLHDSDTKQPLVANKSKSKSKLHKGSKLRNVTLSESILNSLVSYSGVNTDPPPENVDGNENGLGLTATAYTVPPPVSALVPASVFDHDNDLDSVHALAGLDLDSIKTKPPVNGSVSAPRSLRAVLTSQRFVTLSWEEPLQGADKITAYLVLYKAEGSQRERRAAAQGQRTELNIGALQPNTTYVFRVVALVGDRPSPPSASAHATTPPDDWAWGPPRDLRAYPVAPTALKISWQPPAPSTDATAPAPPDRYRVQLVEIESEREQWQSAEGGVTELTVGGLRAGAEYGVRVAAAGGASSAELRVHTPPAAPAAAPVNVTATPASVTSILVRWDAPPARTHRGPLTGYKIRYRAVSGPGAGLGTRRRAESLTTPADARRAELRGLERGTTYQVRVCALNANGSGPFSEWTTASTAPHDLDESSPPSQPPPLRTRAGRDWISVWWSAEGAGAGGVRVRGYTLSWGLGVPDEHTRDLPPHTHSYVIRELQSNAEYVISLRASNNLGPGPPVYATVRTRTADEDDLGERDLPDDESDVPDDDDESDDDAETAPPLIPPVGLKVIMLSGTTAVVYWTDPTLPRGQTAADGRRYVVRWTAAGAAGGRAKTFNATDLNCMIDELKPFTTYEFAVKLIKGGRESSWSMLVSNTTLEAAPGSPPRDVRVTAAPNAARAVELSWAPPLRPNGLVIGYVVMYAAERASTTQDWAAVGVSGPRTSTRVDRLRARTTYLFKIQAKNSKGLGPFSVPVRHTTAMEEGGGALAGATSAWLWASAGGACAVLALAAALALSLCCRRGTPPLSPDRSTYQKSAATAAIKPPDLWIHHDQMELKHIDKGLHGSASKMSAGSVDGGGGGGGALMSSTLTLGRAPPAEYESARVPPPAHPHPGSVDRRHYVPTYVERRCESADSDDTAVLRSSPASLPASCCRRCDYPPMSSVGCAATCERRPHRPPMAAPDQNTPMIMSTALASPQPSLASLQPLHPPPVPCGAGACPLGAACGAPPSAGTLVAGAGSVSGGSDVYAVARERGHYVAYEPLGHYTHRDSMGSEAGGAGAAGSLQRRAGVAGSAGGVAPMHSFVLSSEHASSNHSTPSHGKGSVREASPYKRSGGSSPGASVCGGSGANRLALGGAVAAAGDELEPLTPSRSTERLHREMANLEGLMKDLSAITGHHQFQC